MQASFTGELVGAARLAGFAGVLLRTTLFERQKYAHQEEACSLDILVSSACDAYYRLQLQYGSPSPCFQTPPRPASATSLSSPPLQLYCLQQPSELYQQFRNGFTLIPARLTDTVQPMTIFNPLGQPPCCSNIAHRPTSSSALMRR